LNKETKSNWILDPNGREKFLRANFQTCDKKDAIKREKPQLAYAFIGEKLYVPARESPSQSYQ